MQPRSLINVLRGGRDLPITALAQLTYQRCNKYFVKHRLTNLGSDPFVDRVHALIDARLGRAVRHKITPHHRESGVYEVKTMAYKADANNTVVEGTGNNCQTVNLFRTRECSCGKWQAFHIPCSHVLGVLENNGMSWHSFVDPKFKMISYEATWKPIFYPCPDISYWPDYEGLTHVPNPNFMRNKKGRPKTKRRKNEMDHGFRKKQCANEGGGSSSHVGGSQVEGTASQPSHPPQAPKRKQCSSCKQFGHNKLGCKTKRSNL